MNSLRLTWLLALSLGLTSLIGYPQDFTIDQLSPEYPGTFGAADAINSNGASVRFTAAQLGLNLTHEIDGISYGKDVAYPNGPRMYVRLYYSVNRTADGKAGGAVEAQAKGNGAAGDKFAVEMWDATLKKKSPWLLSDAANHGLSGGIQESDLDGIAYGSPGGVYFSVDPATAASLNVLYPGLGCTAGDILYQDDPGSNPSAPVIWASGVNNLGLDYLDDIDALAVEDAGTVGVLGSKDKVYISLKDGTPNASSYGTASVIKAYPGPLKIVFKPEILGLESDDELNALGGKRIVVEPYTEARLCIHNGGEYYVNGSFHGYPNQGGGKYFPSFTHWTATSNDNAGMVYPWKIRGWMWTGMQADNHNSEWCWQSCLQASWDNRYSPNMSFDYPALYCSGQVPHSGPPHPIYIGTIPSTVPDVGLNKWIYPSGMNGLNPYLNIFATGAASWSMPSTQPYYSYEFGFSIDCASAYTVPSSYSIWEFVWQMKDQCEQYLILSGNEVDCAGNPGNKGRNYSLIGDADNNTFWYWNNTCGGTDVEWAMCLFVCDAVTVPVNAPGASNSANPFASYGFDVGSATITPYLSSDCMKLGFMTEDKNGIGPYRIVLGAFAHSPCVGLKGDLNYRIPHGFDVLTQAMLSMADVLMHCPAPGYPACMHGKTTGAHSVLLDFPADPALICAEFRFSTYTLVKGMPPSASYKVTLF